MLKIAVASFFLKTENTSWGPKKIVYYNGEISNHQKDLIRGIIDSQTFFLNNGAIDSKGVIFYENELSTQLAKTLSCDLLQESDICMIFPTLYSYNHTLPKTYASFNIIKECKIEGVFLMAPDYFIVTIEDKKGIIRWDGSEVVKCKYDEISNKNTSEQIRFSNISEFEYNTYARDINRIFCCVRIKSQWGLIDIKNQQQCIPCEYDDICLSSNYDSINGRTEYKFIKVKQNNRWGLISSMTWQKCIPCEYEEIDGNDFCHKKLVRVKKDGKNYKNAARPAGDPGGRAAV